MDLHRLTRRISEYSYDDDDFPSFPRPPLPPSHESHRFLDFWPFLILFLFLIGVAALVFTCITVLKRRYANYNRTQIRANPETPDVVVAGDDHREFLDENHGPAVDHPIWHIRTVGLTQSAIDSIAVFKYKKDDGLTEETDCTICLNKFLEEETLRILPKCSHAFHIPCIDTWLRSHQNCPLCRSPIECNTTSNAQDSAVEQDSEHLEETQVENSRDLRSNDQVLMGNESFGGLTRDVTSKNPLRIRVLSDISDHRLNIEEELQPMRRSVSLDNSSASVIYRAVSGISQDKHGDSSSSRSQLGEVKESNSKKGLNGVSIARLMKSASFGYSLQKGPSAIMRSFSSFRRMSSRRQDSLLPL